MLGASIIWYWYATITTSRGLFANWRSDIKYSCSTCTSTSGLKCSLSALLSHSHTHTELPTGKTRGLQCVLGETCPLVNVFRLLVVHQTMSLNHYLAMVMLNVPRIFMYSRYLKERVKEFALSATLGKTNAKKPVEKTDNSELYNLDNCAQTNCFIRTIWT